MRITINGLAVDADTPGSATLLDLLRDTLGLTGAKRACDRGECGACTVHLDGRAVYACLTLAQGCAGASVRTIEGLGTPGAPHALQSAFAAEDAAQCGFCTPGQLMAAAALLAANADPSDEQIVAVT